jgi:hypothetical protein
VSRRLDGAELEGTFTRRKFLSASFTLSPVLLPVKKAIGVHMLAAAVLSAFFTVSTPATLVAMPAATVVSVTSAAEATPRQKLIAWILCKISGNKFAFCKK